MLGDEFNEIVMNGEFSQEFQVLIGGDSNVIFVFGEYPMTYNDATMGLLSVFTAHGIVKRSWKRKEVDGVLTVDIPRETRTITISRDSLPDNLTREDFGNTRFKLEGKIWDTSYVVGTDILSFLIKVQDDLEDDRENIPGIAT